MTMQQETRFRCDRCFVEVSVPMNEQPAMERGKPPDGWLILHVATNTSPAWHLCPGCRERFDALMREKGGQ
jgi:hypothetical protein